MRLIDPIELKRSIAVSSMTHDGKTLEQIIDEQPTVEPQIKPITYHDCSNAMLMMWMDKIVTDGEYNKIMDRLNKFEIERRKTEKK